MESINRTLVGIRRFNGELEDNAFEIAYFMTEKEADCGRIYGVSLIKEPADGAPDDNCFEAFLTADKVQADNIISSLIGGQVTPRCAPELIDYLYDSTISLEQKQPARS